VPEGFQLPREGLGYILDVRTLHVFTKQDRFSPGQERYSQGLAETRRIRDSIFRVVGRYPAGSIFTLGELAVAVGVEERRVQRILAANYDRLNVEQSGGHTYRKAEGEGKKTMSGTQRHGKQ